SVTVRERSMVMPRPTALRLESGAMTDTSPTVSRACLAASRPREVMPSSFVSRMRIATEGYEERPVSCPDAEPRARIPHRDAPARPALLGPARRAAPQGRDRFEPRPSAAVDALGPARAADARPEGRAPA